MDAFDNDLVVRIERHAYAEAHRPAIIEISSKGQPISVATYGSLMEEAAQVSHQILQTEGSLIGISCSSKIQYITAMLGVISAGRSCVPLKPVRHLPEGIVDVQDQMITSSGIAHIISDNLDVQPINLKVQVPKTSSIQNIQTSLNPPVIVQFTSGTTGLPKGVQIGASQLSNNLKSIEATFNLNKEDTWATWLPLYHDMGLIGLMLSPLWIGGTVVAINEVDFARNPSLWLRTISNFGSTMTAAPNFAYQRCIDRISDEEMAGLDLSSWRIAVNGAEMPRAETMREFSRKFSDVGFNPTAFNPSYGLAEATLIVTSTAMSTGNSVNETALDPSGAELVSCGLAVPGTKVSIVNAMTLEGLPEQIIGEIAVQSESVMTGYLVGEGGCRLVEPPEWSIDRRVMLLTGDLGFLKNDQLFVCGRLDGSFKWNGMLYTAESVEREVYRIKGVRRCAVCRTNRTEYGSNIGLAVELDDGILEEEYQELVSGIRTAVTKTVSVRIGTIRILPRGSIPVTSSGKVKRHECRSLIELEKEQ